MLPADAYKYDHAFTDLLDNKTSFADVCSLLRSGALTDQFLVTQVGLGGKGVTAGAGCVCCCRQEGAASALCMAQGSRASANRAVPPACGPGAHNAQGIQQHLWRPLHAQPAALHAAAGAAGAAAGAAAAGPAAGGAAEERGGATAAQPAAAERTAAAQTAGRQGAVAPSCCCLAAAA